MFTGRLCGYDFYISNSFFSQQNPLTKIPPLKIHKEDENEEEPTEPTSKLEMGLKVLGIAMGAMGWIYSLKK